MLDRTLKGNSALKGQASTLLHTFGLIDVRANFFFFFFFIKRLFIF